MARIRTIKPEFWMNEELAETSEASRLLAIGLLNHADDEGYFKAHVSLLKAAVFPLTDPSMTIHECLIELSNANYIRLFKGSDGKDYGKVINFTEHQVVNRPKASKISELETNNDSSLINHGKVSDESSQERKGREGNGKDSSVPSGDGTSEYPDDFEVTWKEYPKRLGGNPKKGAFKAWKARVNAGADPLDILDGVKRYAAFCKADKKVGTQYVMQAQTFFGPDEHYLERYQAPGQSDQPSKISAEVSELKKFLRGA